MENITVIFKTSRFNERVCYISKNGFRFDYFGINIYYSFENYSNLISIISEASFLKYDAAIRTRASNWHEASKKWFDDLKLVNVENNEYITSEILGQAIVVDEQGNELCSVDEYNSESGDVKIDGDYHAYRWVGVKDLTCGDVLKILTKKDKYDYVCTDEEIKAILNEAFENDSDKQKMVDVLIQEDNLLELANMRRKEELIFDRKGIDILQDILFG